VDVGKMHLGAPVIGPAQADAFTGKGFAEVVIAALVGEMAGVGDHFDLMITGIDHRIVVFAEASGTGVVILGWRVLIERLMGALVIIGVPPAFEATLLGRQVRRGWLGGLGLQVAMHAFVRTVVLRRSRAGELHLDALLDPPRSEEHTSELQSRENLVCRLLLEKK